jgi:hypothetical protein
MMADYGMAADKINVKPRRRLGIYFLKDKATFRD